MKWSGCSETNGKGRNAALNGITNVTAREANVFDLLHDLDGRGERFDTVILDPPLATTGECLELTWPQVAPAKPSCASASGGSGVKCK